MPKKKKEPFIDPENATTYRLVPGFVPDDPYEEKLAETEEEIEKRKAEQRSSGVFFEDNYNYMKHMRSLKETAVMVKVSDLEQMEEEMMSSFGGSCISRPVSSMMRPASSIGAPASSIGPPGSSFSLRLSSTQEKQTVRIDPDILQAFDEATKVKVSDDGELEAAGTGTIEDLLADDFVNIAGGYKPKPERIDEDDFEIDRGFAIDDEQDLGSDFDDFDFDIEDNNFNADSDLQQFGGRGTVQDDIIEAQTALILKNFEEGLGFSHVAQDIDEEDGIATAEDHEYLREIVEAERRKQEKIVTAEQLLDDHTDRPDFNYAKYENGGEEEEEFEWKDAPPSKPKFDCVSILSLNSNTRNLPTDLIPPSCQKKRPKDPSVSETEPSSEETRGLSRRELEDEIRLSRRADKASTFKPKGETPEEKRLRKKAVKDERQERRQEKKANKVVFSTERQKLAKEFASSSKAGKGMKLS